MLSIRKWQGKNILTEVWVFTTETRILYSNQVSFCKRQQKLPPHIRYIFMIYIWCVSSLDYFTSVSSTKNKIMQKEYSLNLAFTKVIITIIYASCSSPMPTFNSPDLSAIIIISQGVSMSNYKERNVNL